ncbi:MAG: hypothetical protein AAB691_02380 [Patescibacteria group bacterium]
MRKEKNIVIAVLLILAVGVAVYSLSAKPAGPETEIRSLVTEFGKKMQFVTLTAPKETVIQSIKENYGPYISEGLLEGFVMAPERAPGRLTASPWPDRIEIISIDPTDDGAYDVQGVVVEVTSTEVGTDKAASQYQVALKVRNQNGTWVITGFSKAIQS